MSTEALREQRQGEDVLNGTGHRLGCRQTTDVLTGQQFCCMLASVTSREFKRWLQKQGCQFEPGKGGHLLVRLGNSKSVLAMHGSHQELPKGTVEAIKKQLGLK